MPPTDLGAWEEFVGKIVDRYGPDDKYGLAAVEVWNEPNLAFYWKGQDYPGPDGDPHGFAELVRRASNAVRSRNLGIKVVSGAMSPTGVTNEETYLRKATNCDTGACITPNVVNGVGVHLYADGATSSKRVRGRMNEEWTEIDQALAGKGFDDVHRWITEVGFPSAPGNGQSDKAQGKRAEVAFKVFARRDARAFLVHRFRDDTAFEGYRYGVMPQSNDNPKAGANGAYCRLAGLRDTGLPGAC